MQSNYDFAMLNEWGGGLTLDEENGTILSTMLGAGRKNSKNQFSGVLIGAIDDGTGLEDTATQTGVYGLHNGVISYALKEDGTATFGKAGHGQIKIDGNKGTIKSAEYDNGHGMFIDMDDGIFSSKANFYFKQVEINATEFEPKKYYYETEDGGYSLAEEFEGSKTYYEKLPSQSEVYISPTNTYFKVKST